MNLGIFPKGDTPNGFVYFGLTILALFLALAVHELGHLVAGIVQGFRFELFIVGLLGIKRVDGRVKVFLNKNIGYMGGIAATVPTRQGETNRYKLAMVVAAGPIASFLFAFIDFLLFANSLSGAARGFWFVVGAGSFAVFLATTLPSKSGIFFSDRVRFQRLISKGEAGKMEEALLTLIAIHVRDNSCSNIPLAKARLLQSDKDGIMKFWGYYYEYCHFNDNAMLSEAGAVKEHLFSLKSSIPAHLWTALKIDATVADG